LRPTVLVTGATGSIGRFVVQALIGAGYLVRGQYLRAPGNVPGVDWRRWDFLESLEVDPLVDGCDAVIHLAAELSDIGKMDRINVDATRALAETAAASGARYFGHASSIVVYGSPRTRRVDEQTPLIDLARPVAKQYCAEPYMLEYARTKTMAELALREAAPAIRIDLLRPTVVADSKRILEAANWSTLRKTLCLYRRTQYVLASDVASAIAHLLRQGLQQGSDRIEAYNICDDACGTFRELFARAYEITHNPRYSVPFELPIVADMAKNWSLSRTLGIRFPLGMLRFANDKLCATGFRFPTGVEAALEQSLLGRVESPKGNTLPQAVR
jgi:nucleoside-diphosphate-sugar epimerase